MIEEQYCYYNTEIIKILIDSCSNINAKNKSGRTVLIHTCIKTNFYHEFYYGVIKLLIDSVSDVNLQDKEGQTTLLLAIVNFENLDAINYC